MAHTTMKDMQPHMEKFGDAMRKFKAENPHLFEPVQIIVEKDDGTEVDLCDISRPLEDLLDEAA